MLMEILLSKVYEKIDLTLLNYLASHSQSQFSRSVCNSSLYPSYDANSNVRINGLIIQRLILWSISAKRIWVVDLYPGIL